MNKGQSSPIPFQNSNSHGGREASRLLGIYSFRIILSPPPPLTTHVDMLVARWHAWFAPAYITHRRRGHAPPSFSFCYSIPRVSYIYDRAGGIYDGPGRICRRRKPLQLLTASFHNRIRRSSAIDEDEAATEAASPSSSHGAVSLIGRRREMEDAVTAAPGFASSVADRRIPAPPAYDFFGVYDGHCRASVACACRLRPPPRGAGGGGGGAGRVAEGRRSMEGSDGG